MPGFHSTIPEDRKTPVRIAFCITELDPGGAERSLLEIVSRLDRGRWETHVFSLASGGILVKEFEERGIPVTCLGGRSIRDWRVLFKLKRELTLFQPAIVQGFLFHGNIASRIAATWAGVPIRVAGHRVAEKEKHWHMRVERLTRRWVDHHICVSQGVAQHLQTMAGLKPEYVSVVPNGVKPFHPPCNPGSIRREFEIEACAPLVLAVGRLHRQKGFDVLIPAFRDVLLSHPSARLIIVGEGPERHRLTELISSCGVEGKVHLPGFRSDLDSFYQDASVFVLSSRWEGMPNVLLKAMSAGLPIVATSVEGVPELVTDGVSARLVRSEDRRGLRMAMLELLNSPDVATTFSNQAQGIAEAEFTWERAACLFDQIYTELLTRSSV